MDTPVRKDYATVVKETADLLTVSKVAVYPIGAEGMMVEHVCDPANQHPSVYTEGAK